MEGLFQSLIEEWNFYETLISFKNIKGIVFESEHHRWECSNRVLPPLTNVDADIYASLLNHIGRNTLISK